MEGVATHSGNSGIYWKNSYQGVHVFKAVFTMHKVTSLSIFMDGIGTFFRAIEWMTTDRFSQRPSTRMPVVKELSMIC
jgi:hypothetical protein